MPVSQRKLSGVPWLQIALETFFVIQELVGLALRNIRAEMEENRAAVRQAASYHQDLIARLQKEPGMEGVPFKPAIIRNNAWEAAQSSQAVAKMDFAVIAAVSEMEELQDHYQRLVQGIMPEIYGSGIKIRQPVFMDLLSFEKMLIEVYDETEQALANSPATLERQP